MNQKIPPVLFFALGLAASSIASAGVRVDIDPFGFVAPPVVYAPYPYYGAPPVVYVGGGGWGHDRGGRGRGGRGGGGRRR
jgi:hypothetical protein